MKINAISTISNYKYVKQKQETSNKIINGDLNVYDEKRIINTNHNNLII